MWIRGNAPLFYAECYAGSLDLNENIPVKQISGKISFDEGDPVIEGNTTFFRDEIRQGQFIYAGSELLVVEEILDDLHFRVYRAPSASAANVYAYLMPVLQNLDARRATFIRGSLLNTEQGSIIGVGDGEVRINGLPLTGGSLTLKRKAQIALFDAVTETFTIYDLGFSKPTGITAAGVAGGTRGMTAGARSFRVAKARKQTGGFGNPSDPIAFNLTAGQKPEISFPAMDASEGQNAWSVFGTLFESSTSLSPVEGPWYEVALLTDSDVSPAGGNYDLEYLNSEISRSQLVSFDNTPPSDAEFVSALVGYPVYISCQGKGNSAKPDGTSPGPFIIPAKPNNIEAAPLKRPNPVAVSPLEDIIGFLPGVGRIFLMTKNHLNFASFTGNPQFPVTIRPYWERGFANPFSLIMVGKEIFGSTSGGLFRSASEADEAVTEYSFGADVEEFLRTYNSGHRLSGYDPKNEAVCVFYSGAYKNQSGYWTTVILPFLLKQNFWSTPIVLSSDTRDMIVSGCATVGNHLEFLCGGYSSETSQVEIRTYRFDERDGNSTEEVPWQLVWSFSDDGEEQRAKVIKGIRVTGKTTNASYGIFGSRSNTQIDVAAIETGNLASVTGLLPIPDTSNVTVGAWNNDLIVRELLLYAPGVEGKWNGEGMKDRIDEIVVEVSLGGFRK